MSRSGCKWAAAVEITIDDSGHMLKAQSQSQGKAAADAVAAPLKRGILQRKCACGQHTIAGGECDDCSKNQGTIQRAPGNAELPNRDSGGVPPIVPEVLRSSGQPLDATSRAFFEPRFGHDFSRVRVHTDARAAESASAVDALAYTVGADIVFGTGHYAPTTAKGQRLLAHELTHVVQQHGRAADGPLRVDKADAQGECEAEAVASRVMAGLPVHVHQQSHVLQRYGHANSCKDDSHLKPFVWPGHHRANQIAQRAAEQTDGRPLEPSIAGRLKTFFGRDSTDPANVAQIHSNFLKIQTALNENYLYHCSSKGDSSDSDALKCKGQNAETDRSGRKDITLCFDQVAGWSAPAAAWVIVHENVHRGLNIWSHGWEAGKVDRCINKQASTASLEIDNPDGYACFAVLL